MNSSSRPFKPQTVAEAERAVAATRYPPRGGRGHRLRQHQVPVDENGELAGRIEFEKCRTVQSTGEHTDGDRLEFDTQLPERPPYSDRTRRRTRIAS
jgi:hypothetical protein